MFWICYKHYWSNFSFLDEWEDSLKKEAERITYSKNNCIDGLHGLRKGEQTKVLLRLLKHALSELQRDHRLARAIVLYFIEIKAFEHDGAGGLDAFRYFLSIVKIDFIQECEGHCHQRLQGFGDGNGNDDLNHFCSDWKKFVNSLKLFFTVGIEHITEIHAAIFNAAVIDQYNAAGFQYIDGDDLPSGWEDEVDFRSRSLDLVFVLIEGFGMHAAQDRQKLKDILQQTRSECESDKMISTIKLEDCAASYYNSLKGLVGIGRSTLRFLPADEYTAGLGGILIRTLVAAFINEPIDASPQGTYVVKDSNLSLIEPKRYSDMIVGASQLQQRRYKDAQTFLEGCDMEKIETNPLVGPIFLSDPPQDVLNVVRGLFLRQIVDVSSSGCGYGDFHVLCHLHITPFDPLLYEHSANFPEDESDQVGYFLSLDYNLNGADSIPEREHVDLKGLRLAARYDFTLLMMKRAWSSPWEMSSHASFQRPYRIALHTLALCAHRYGMPVDVTRYTFTFLPRTWWPDDRSLCWRYECQHNDLKRRISSDRKYLPGFKIGEERNKSIKMIPCPDCHIAHACSQNHLNAIFREGHRRVCQTPPLRPFSNDDEALCREVLGEHLYSESAECALECDESIDFDDDASCWESIDSSDDLKDVEGVTDIIFRYFDQKKYKVQKMEDQAFFNIYGNEV